MLGKESTGKVGRKEGVVLSMGHSLWEKCPFPSSLFSHVSASYLLAEGKRITALRLDPAIPGQEELA